MGAKGDLRLRFAHHEIRYLFAQQNSFERTTTFIDHCHSIL